MPFMPISYRFSPKHKIVTGEVFVFAFHYQKMHEIIPPNADMRIHNVFIFT